SAVDLELLFDVVAGPVAGEDAAWRLDVPGPRADRLADFRVAVMPALSLVQPSSEMQGKVDELTAFLSNAGAKVAEAMPDVDHHPYFTDYLTLLALITSLGTGVDERHERARQSREHGDLLAGGLAMGLTIDAHGYIALLGRRERARAAWRSF